MTELSSSAIMPDITFYIGDSTITEGTYGFEDLPNNCGNEQTVTISGLPSFVTHDPINRVFTIPSNTDDTKIGAYTVTITSKISVRNDISSTSETEFAQSQTFVIYIEPC